MMQQAIEVNPALRPRFAAYNTARGTDISREIRIVRRYFTQELAFQAVLERFLTPTGPKTAFLE